MLSSLLRFGDRLSMAHSREVRLPFCDPGIAEFVFSLPPELLVGEGQVKRVLRLAIRGLVPDAIVTRAKQGFVPPQHRWLVGPLSGFVADLASDAGPLGERLDVGCLQQLAGADTATRQREAVSVWDMTNLLAWSRFALAPMQKSADFDPSAAGETRLAVASTHRS